MQIELKENLFNTLRMDKFIVISFSFNDLIHSLYFFISQELFMIN